VLPDVGGEAVPGHAADARTDDLDADHERQGEQYRPQHAVTELRARLRIARDAARIVVRGAGDEAWPQLLQQRQPGRRPYRRGGDGSEFFLFCDHGCCREAARRCGSVRRIPDKSLNEPDDVESGHAAAGSRASGTTALLSQWDYLSTYVREGYDGLIARLIEDK